MQHRQVAIRSKEQQMGVYEQVKTLTLPSRHEKVDCSQWSNNSGVWALSHRPGSSYGSLSRRAPRRMRILSREWAKHTHHPWTHGPPHWPALVSSLRDRANAGESQARLVEWLCALVQKQGIRLRHDRTPPSRMILSYYRARALNPLRTECNDAVIDTWTWAMPVVPPWTFIPRPVAKMVDQALAAGLYYVLHVYDGTMVSLYC